MQNQLTLSEFIYRVKQDLLAETMQESPKLFSMDEITLEVNFVVTGKIDSGFNFGVVSLGSDVSEERIQKVTIKMTPLVSKEQLIESINNSPEKVQQILDSSIKTVLRDPKGEF